MFIIQALRRNLGTPSSAKKRKVTGATGGATQGAEPREPPQPALAAQGAAQGAPPPPLLSQEAGNGGCTPEEAEQQPLFGGSPSPGGTPSYTFKRFPQPKGRSFLDRNTTKAPGQQKLSAGPPAEAAPAAVPVSTYAYQPRGKRLSDVTGSDLSLAFEGEAAVLVEEEGGTQQPVAVLQTRPEQSGGARAPGFVELPVDRGLHTEAATRPWPEAAAAARIKPFMERVKSILPESTAVAALEQAPKEWDPMGAGSIPLQAPPEPATENSRLGEVKAREEHINEEADSAYQHAWASSNSLTDRLGSLKLSLTTQRGTEALTMELKQLEHQLSVMMEARKAAPPALPQRAPLLAPEAEQDRAVSPAQSFISIPESEASEALSSEDLQEAVGALSDEDLEQHLAALSQGYYEAYGEALNDAAAASRPQEVLVLHERSNIEIDRKHMACMKPLTWLNDEIINIYMALLIERDRRRREQGLGPKCHFFNSFFANKLYKDHGYAYQPASRWTRPKPLGRTGQLSSSVLDLDLLLVPVHQGVHWVCAAVDLQRKEFVYYDSLGGEDRTCLEMLARWLTDEFKDKRGEVVDLDSWPRRFPKDIPQQHNGCDCGMFAILFADYASLRKPMQFGQQDIDYFRVKLVNNILRNVAD